jgi:hypothetical protein
MRWCVIGLELQVERKEGFLLSRIHTVFSFILYFGLCRRLTRSTIPSDNSVTSRPISVLTLGRLPVDRQTDRQTDIQSGMPWFSLPGVYIGLMPKEESRWCWTLQVATNRSHKEVNCQDCAAQWQMNEMWLWQSGGMILTGKHRNFGGKTSFGICFHLDS